MLFHAKNGLLKMGDWDMHYVRFGNGKRPLIMLPGVGDGLKTAKGMAGLFAVLYRDFARDFTVYVFSRRNKLPRTFTTVDMAEDVAAAMEALHIRRADILGVSQGGMIAQHLAIRHPEKVHKLVLVVTLPRPSQTLVEALSNDIRWARQKNFTQIMVDTADRSYTGGMRKVAMAIYRVMARWMAPKDMTRFITLCEAGIESNAYDELGKITCPTLVIGGREDRMVGVTGSYELAEGITDSRLYIYDEYSHGLYEQAGDFNRRVRSFLKNNEKKRKRTKQG